MLQSMGRYAIVALCCAIGLESVSSSEWLHTREVPTWQTVVPDTSLVVNLGVNNWRLYSTDGRYESSPTRIPSDLLTNLMEGGLVDDPYMDRNFLTQRHVWMGDHVVDDNEHYNRTRTWVYETTFELPTSSDRTWKLVVEGIKMGAHLSVNGVHLETVSDQFLRYVLTLQSHHLSSGQRIPGGTSQHTLTVTFDPDIEVDGRFMACSGGWDWAPYVKSHDAQGKRSFTLGIVKPLYLVAVQNHAILHVVPKVYYRGTYPRSPLTKAEGDFEVQIDIHLDVVATLPSQAQLFVRIPVIDKTLEIPIQSSPLDGGDGTVVSVNTTFPKGVVDLWWPNGMGKQRMYDIFVGYRDRNDDESSTVFLRKRIGRYSVNDWLVLDYCELIKLLTCQDFESLRWLPSTRRISIACPAPSLGAKAQVLMECTFGSTVLSF